MSEESRVYLSSPHLGHAERVFVKEAFDTNWVSPLGPNVNGFEREFCAHVECAHAAALSSGTAGIHLALRLAGVDAGDEVFVSTFTFVASVNPILYVGATPVFIGSERASWNMDPELLTEALESRAAQGRLPGAVIVVHLYGQCADMDPILEVCARYGVTVIEDAAEALGSDYKGRHAGTMGRMGVFSFNGNKIITTSGGGMLISEEEALIVHARKLATQARDSAPHYQHSEMGHNYRLSNVSAGIGRGQLQVLEDRVLARRANYTRYAEELGGLAGLTFAPEAPWGRHTRWLTCIRIDPEAFGVDHSSLQGLLAERNIESRLLWKPMHMQPLFEGLEVFGGEVSEEVFADGLCLPSGSNMTSEEHARVVGVLREAHLTIGRA